MSDYFTEHPSPLGEVTWLPIDELKPYRANPRNIPEHAIDQVAKSIHAFGWQQPIVCDGDRVIIIGHTRHLAAMKLGEAKVPVIIETRLNDDQVKALRIADNRTHDYTTWDYPLLLAELEGLDSSFSDILDLADWEGIITGFEEALDESLLDIDDETRATLTDNYVLTITFTDKVSADQAGLVIIDLPGVINVRYTGNKSK